MTTDHKRLIAEARMFAEARGERRDTAIVSRLADALEAATVAPAVNREALADLIGNVYNREHYDPAHRAADAVIASGLLADRAVVEAQDLERAAAALYLAESWPGKPGSAELGEPWLLNADAELAAEWSAWVADHDRLVEAQALEQAADDLHLVLSMLDSANQNNQIDYGVYSEVHDVIAIALHQIEGARAVEIREGRQ